VNPISRQDHLVAPAHQLREIGLKSGRVNFGLMKEGLLTRPYFLAKRTGFYRLRRLFCGDLLYMFLLR
jgi:hypothetical protein